MIRVFILVATLLATSVAVAQQRKPITFIVAAAAGAANDLLARTIAAELKDDFGPAIVENRPGASGVIGAEFVKRSAPDGRTFLVVPSSQAIMIATGAKLPFDFLRDFAPVIHSANLPFYLVVNQDALPTASVADVVRRIRDNPGKTSYGTAGIGSPHHFAAEMFKERAGIDMLHVPYKGMALGIPDLMEGRIQLVITGLPAVNNAMKSGKLKVLATMDPRRTMLNPNVPTFIELGFKDMVMETWLGIVAPAGTPRAAIDQANAAFARALNTPQARDKLAVQGLEVVGGTPEAFEARIRQDIERFARIARAANIKLE